MGEILKHKKLADPRLCGIEFVPYRVKRPSISPDRLKELETKYFQKLKLPHAVGSVAELVKQNRDEAAGRR